MSSKVKVLPSNGSYRELQSIESPNTADNPVVSIGSHSKSCRFCCQKLRTQDSEYPLRSIPTPSIWLVEDVDR